jgi:cyclase
MTLAVRIIPTLCYEGPKLLKGEKFMPWRNCGHVLQQARVHATRGVDELIMLDVKATLQKREPDYKLIHDLTADTFTPVTVGGGIKSPEHIKRLLEAGADKVSIRQAFLDSPWWVSKMVERYGSQAIVVAIDYRKGEEAVATHFAGRANDIGAGEILLTSMDREGTMEGYDIPTIKKVADIFKGPVIAHGGCKDVDDMEQAIKAGASAVAVGALFQFTELTPKQAAERLHKRGYETRI